MRPIRASEVSSYLYCARAWWYGRQGIQSSNQTEMTSGTVLHRLHSRKVMRFYLLQALAWFLLLVSLVLLTIYFVKPVI